MKVTCTPCMEGNEAWDELIRDARGDDDTKRPVELCALSPPRAGPWSLFVGGGREGGGRQGRHALAGVNTGSEWVSRWVSLGFAVGCSRVGFEVGLPSQSVPRWH